MRTLEASKFELDLKSFIRRGAAEKDAKTLIDSDTLVTHQGKPIILYAKLDVDTDELRWAVKRLQFNKTIRTTGLKTESAIFGYNPRNVIRKDYCSASRTAYDQPAEHAVIAEFGKKLSDLYRTNFPDVFSRHESWTQDNIRSEWTIDSTPFTSGIVNRNNPLKYHFDAGNVKNVLSNMVVMKKGVEGGRLACPEYDLMLDCSDSSVVLFDGQKILHGVTPINRITPDAYRYSVVYYTLQQMWQCLPVNDEIARIRRVHTQRERNRAAGKIDPDSLARNS